MKYYDLYGYDRDSDLESARLLTEGLIGLKLEPHESSYRGGGYYRFGGSGSEHFILQKNLDALQAEWIEPNFKNYGILLFVNETVRAEFIEKKLVHGGLSLLRREQL